MPPAWSRRRRCGRHPSATRARPWADSALASRRPSPSVTSRRSCREMQPSGGRELARSTRSPRCRRWPRNCGRRGAAVPVLRLPFADLDLPAPPDGFDTEVVLPLRSADARQLVAGLLADLDATLLLTLPALGLGRGAPRWAAARAHVVTSRRRHVDRRRSMAAALVVRAVDPELLAGSPGRRAGAAQLFADLGGAVDEVGRPTALPDSVAAVVHAPTPTDEPLTLPALLIAALPLDPSRRHIADGRAARHDLRSGRVRVRRAGARTAGD